MSGWFGEKREGGREPHGARAGFTLIELLVVVTIITLLAALMVPVLGKARAVMRQAVCLSNVRQLQFAWQAYADSNGDRIVNGVGSSDWSLTSADESWLFSRAWAKANNRLLTREEWLEAWKTGALWPYVHNVKVYECAASTVKRRLTTSHQVQPYSIVCSMNVFSPPGPGKTWDAMGVPSERWAGQTVLHVKKTSEITSPPPAARMVFFDTFWAGQPYVVCYDRERWTTQSVGAPLCAAFAQHSNGTVASYADGHSQPWRWQSAKTIACAKVCLESTYTGDPAGITEWPDSVLVSEDLYRIQRAVWGRLGYTPTGK